MKILVATSFSQGLHASDFCFTLEAELVFVGEVCDKEKEFASGGHSCGCSGVFIGFASGHPTTTARVVDLPITVDDYVEFLRLALSRWEYDEFFVKSLAFYLLELANCWEVGSVLGRDFWIFLLRSKIFEDLELF